MSARFTSAATRIRSSRSRALFGKAVPAAGQAGARHDGQEFARARTTRPRRRSPRSRSPAARSGGDRYSSADAGLARDVRFQSLEPAAAGRHATSSTSIHGSAASSSRGNDPFCSTPAWRSSAPRRRRHAGHVARRRAARPITSRPRRRSNVRPQLQPHAEVDGALDDDLRPRASSVREPHRPAAARHARLARDLRLHAVAERQLRVQLHDLAEGRSGHQVRLQPKSPFAPGRFRCLKMWHRLVSSEMTGQETARYINGRIKHLS